MTKTLTEQWREGTLDGGYYYLKMKDGNIFIDHTEYIFWAHEIRWETKDSSYVKEVLAPVPSYDHFSQLVKKVERLQEQLKEANEALKDVCMHAETEQFECRCGWVEPCKDCNAHYAARDYLKKWGVK